MTLQSVQRTARQIVSDQAGATIVEFAIIAPIALAFLMFLFDTGYRLYVDSVLAGEVDAAARFSTLETATDENRAALDARVTEAVQTLVPQGEVTFNRVAYGSYKRAQSKMEAFADSNGNNICDNNEVYDDANGNGRHDVDAGRVGGGGANDVVIYTVTLNYDRLFPMAGLLGWNQRVVTSAKTLLRNQPFDKQAVSRTGNCT
jgi:Flp pilus assembly protein TadG